MFKEGGDLNVSFEQARSSPDALIQRGELGDSNHPAKEAIMARKARRGKRK